MSVCLTGHTRDPAAAVGSAHRGEQLHDGPDLRGGLLADSPHLHEVTRGHRVPLAAHEREETHGQGHQSSSALGELAPWREKSLLTTQLLQLLWHSRERSGLPFRSVLNQVP